MGFGVQGDSGNVFLKNADNGGAGFLHLDSIDYLDWTDTQIIFQLHYETIFYCALPLHKVLTKSTREVEKNNHQKEASIRFLLLWVLINSDLLLNEAEKKLIGTEYLRTHSRWRRKIKRRKLLLNPTLDKVTNGFQ